MLQPLQPAGLINLENKPSKNIEDRKNKEQTKRHGRKRTVETRINGNQKGRTRVEGKIIRYSRVVYFPGSPMVKNPPANAGDTGSIPSRGIFHMPWGS